MELELKWDPFRSSMPVSGQEPQLEEVKVSSQLYYSDFTVFTWRRQHLVVGQNSQVLLSVLGSPGQSLSSQIFLPVEGGTWMQIPHGTFSYAETLSHSRDPKLPHSCFSLPFLGSHN